MSAIDWHGLARAAFWVSGAGLCIVVGAWMERLWAMKDESPATTPKPIPTDDFAAGHFGPDVVPIEITRRGLD